MMVSLGMDEGREWWKAGNPIMFSLILFFLFGFGG